MAGREEPQAEEGKEMAMRQREEGGGEAQRAWRSARELRCSGSVSRRCYRNLLNY